MIARQTILMAAVVALAASVPCTAGEGTVNLAAVEPVQRTGEVSTDRNPEKGPLDLGDVVYATGLGVRAGSDLTYDVSQRAGRFEAWAGIDPNASAGRSGRFRVYADRDLVFSVCEWGRERPWLWAPGFNAEMWRTTYDVKDKWTSTYDNNGGIGVLRSAHQNEALGPFVGPGRWNDLDMLQVGLDGFDYGHDRKKAGFDITPDEERFQMTLWAVLASPLLAANDVTAMNEQTRSILLNRQVIAASNLAGIRPLMSALRSCPISIRVCKGLEVSRSSHIKRPPLY